MKSTPDPPNPNSPPPLSLFRRTNRSRRRLFRCEETTLIWVRKGSPPPPPIHLHLHRAIDPLSFSRPGYPRAFSAWVARQLTITVTWEGAPPRPPPLLPSSPHKYTFALLAVLGRGYPTSHQSLTHCLSGHPVAHRNSQKPEEVTSSPPRPGAEPKLL